MGVIVNQDSAIYEGQTISALDMIDLQLRLILCVLFSFQPLSGKSTSLMTLKVDFKGLS
jgi:hypothetical protein